MIRADNLIVTRGGRRILDLPALSIAPGGVFGILGPNGAGKSTLLRVLAGEMAPDSGRAFLDGRPLGHWRAGDLARRRAVLPQHSTLGFPLRAEEVVALGRLPHAGRAGPQDSVRAAMREAGVAHLHGRNHATLSGGEQQRVQLARVLAQLDGVPPADSVLFLDEPTSALDLPHQHAIMAVAAARARAGATVVAVLHDLNLAARHCGRLLLMAGGRRVAEGRPEEMLTPELVHRAYGFAMRRVPDPQGGDVLLVPA
ncbi:heme ABC transporter ATP-binding protein [Roseococcus microcysteis]|uniref:heme ABC transporter ATP-binding protein n=1 Tax=Roseococcus microcysteis TaxID=2771361 RepID=UPI00168B0B49|nr:heme ABC transporter ATP-binding protein [Roseococcus microcysteis]